MVLFLLIRRVAGAAKCQSPSTLSSENASVSDGEEGNTSDRSRSGTPDVVSNNTDDLLSQGSEIPADAPDVAQVSEGSSGREAALRRITIEQNNCEVMGLSQGQQHLSYLEDLSRLW